MNSKQPSPPIIWGLYSKETDFIIPLKSLDINIEIIHNVARVFYTQVYQNQTDSFYECEFFFPMSPDACFDSFEAKFNNTIIKGVVKEKNQAKEEYKEAISQGRTAAYSEINEETGDIMKVLIGNIPPNSEISIVYSYIEKLETSLNKFWCFRLFSTITPRYNNDLKEIVNKDLQILAGYPLISKNDKNAYPWTIKAEVQSPSPIKIIKSPSHDIKTQYGNENHTCSVTLDPKKPHFPNKDFVLLYSNGKEGEKVDYVLTPFEEGYCAMISLMADFEKSSEADAYEKFVKAKTVESQHAMNTIRGEYIFLIDRSGSMSNGRIEMAKKSLLLFLKSLPKDSYCNVVSFGTQFEFLRHESVAYSQDSLKSLTADIEHFSADMGGTQILNPLKAVFDLKKKTGYPRFIFLLTDGAVGNTDSVLELIKKNNEKARVFTVGIGNGFSPVLITKGALYGRGKYEFVSDIKETYEKVISLLNASLSPCYTDFSLESENFDAVVKSVSPNPTNIHFLLNGQTATFFLMLREAVFDEKQKMNLKLKMYDTRIANYRTIEITLDKENLFKNEHIPKLAIHDMIQRLEEAEKENKDLVGFSNIVWTKKENKIKKRLLKLSLKYGILCKETAFFCDVKENNEVRDTTQVKVLVPAIASYDYGINPSHRPPGSYLCTIGCDFDPETKRIIEMHRRKLRESGQTATAPITLSSAKNLTPYSQGGFFSNLASGISNAFNSLFTSKTSSKESSSFGKKTTISQNTSQQKNQTGAYLDVIMKQTFEGNWEAKDQKLAQTVLKNDKLPEVPKKIKVNVQVNLENLWMTVLVLLWLEVACQSNKDAWTLIHQKGCEWLKSQGVDYEEVKSFGNSAVKV